MNKEELQKRLVADLYNKSKREILNEIKHLNQIVGFLESCRQNEGRSGPIHCWIDGWIETAYKLSLDLEDHLKVDKELKTELGIVDHEESR